MDQHYEPLMRPVIEGIMYYGFDYYQSIAIHKAKIGDVHIVVNELFAPNLTNCQNFLEELRILTQYSRDNEHILSIVDAIVPIHIQHDSVIFALEEHLQLTQYLQSNDIGHGLTNIEVHFAKQILNGMMFLLSKHQQRQQQKPLIIGTRNVYVCNGNDVLCCKIFPSIERHLSSFQEFDTVFEIPPEWFIDRLQTCESALVHMYSMILYLIVTGTLPYSEHRSSRSPTYSLIKRIADEHLKPIIPEECRSRLRSIIEQIFGAHQISDRPTFNIINMHLDTLLQNQSPQFIDLEIPMI